MDIYDSRKLPLNDALSVMVDLWSMIGNILFDLSSV